MGVRSLFRVWSMDTEAGGDSILDRQIESRLHVLNSNKPGVATGDCAALHKLSAERTFFSHAVSSTSR